jgi:hypothetical protein
MTTVGSSGAVLGVAIGDRVKLQHPRLFDLEVGVLGALEGLRR